MGSEGLQQGQHVLTRRRLAAWVLWSLLLACFAQWILAGLLALDAHLGTGLAPRALKNAERLTIYSHLGDDRATHAMGLHGRSWDRITTRVYYGTWTRYEPEGQNPLTVAPPEFPRERFLELVRIWKPGQNDQVNPDAGPSRINKNQVTWHGAGWPASSLQGFDVTNLAQSLRAAGSIKPLESKGLLVLASEPGAADFVPVLPNWTGASINTAVFFVPAALMLTPFVIGKQLLRSARRRCVLCGYRLDGITGDRCPECGGALLTNPTAAADDAGDAA